ncbi:RCC1/BLIP-II [Glarea lozoyensis ATCC 20868]|uniref:RCC1/BLIP-II n=1 Tax=Glarea lozoyensis (strain ATCC 20868 / MF5171) TaxID=1116229 RepID=S3DL78_GLAL2|nr:RCC1/BLIP-II [Glarea lozoyensis ATCC 20868]EPE27293.1 RCC1/BLIP-II [Glarea lozoyensis ATCC 20868]
MLPNFVLETPTSEEPYGAELWACGFNAWGQLDFDGEERNRNLGKKTALKGVQYEDYRVWTKRLVDQENITFLKGGYNSVIVKTGSDTDYLANNKILSKLPDDLDYPIGQLCGMVREAWCTAFNTREVTIMAGNPPTIQYFDYLNPHTRTKKSDQETFPFSDVVQIVANATAFQALSSTGEVVSWGDSRYPQVLARPVTDQTPAKTPHPILSVRDLPTGRIRKISAGPYFTAGITTGNDLYIWGQPPPGPENEEEPNPINSLLDDDAVSIDCHGHDILDVACGKDCMLVLTVNHKLFVLGSNANGQLGLGDVESVAEWTEVTLPLKEGGIIKSVHTGYKNSFVVVENPRDLGIIMDLKARQVTLDAKMKMKSALQKYVESEGRKRQLEHGEPDNERPCDVNTFLVASCLMDLNLQQAIEFERNRGEARRSVGKDEKTNDDDGDNGMDVDHEADGTVSGDDRIGKADDDDKDGR